LREDWRRGKGGKGTYLDKGGAHRVLPSIQVTGKKMVGKSSAYTRKRNEK